MATPLPSNRHHLALSEATAFVRKVEVTATRGGDSATLVPTSGSVTQDARRSMRWNGSMTVAVDRSLLPTGPADLLTPFGTLVSVDAGVQLSDGSVSMVPLGRFSLDASSVSITPNSRSVSLTLVDLANIVALYRFESPFDVSAGTDLADAINSVIVDRLGVGPGLSTTGLTLARARVFGLDPELDPWREMSDLAADFGFRLWYDRAGNLVLDQPPIPDPTSPIPVIGPLSVNGAFDSRPPNVVVARGEASDDSVPVQAVVMDDDTSSPTYAGATPGSSPYGRITRFYASPQLLTAGQAQLAAASILAGTAGAGATWDVGRPFDPTWDPDDVIIVAPDDSTSLTMVVDSMTMNLTGETVLACRGISELT